MLVSLAAVFSIVTQDSSPRGVLPGNTKKEERCMMILKTAEKESELLTGGQDV